MLQTVARGGDGILEDGGVVVLPGGGNAGFPRPLRRARVPVILAVGEVPGDDEANSGGLAGREAEVSGDGAVGVLAGRVRGVAPILEPPGGGEVAPVDFEVAEPQGSALEPVSLLADVGRVGGQGEVAIGDVIGIESIGGELEGSELGPFLEAVDIVRGERIPERAGDGVGDGLLRGVLDFDLEEGGREAGVLFIEGDEGVEGGHAEAAGELPLGEGEGGERELAAELHIPEVRHPCQVLASRPEAEANVLAGLARAVIGRGQVAVEDACVEHLAARLGLNGEVGEAVRAALVRPVEDLPVDQAAVAGEPNAAGPDAAEGEGDLCGIGAFVDEAVHGGLRCEAVRAGSSLFAGAIPSSAAGRSGNG